MRAIKVVTLALAAAVVATACEKAQLLAPTRSTISVSAPTRLLPTNGSTEITAVVIEEAGTPVQNGTTVRFTTSLGRVDPVEVQTRNGIAITTFFAGNTSGVARVSATSGGATGGDGDDLSNVVEITVGNAAVKAVSVRANPGSVSPNGGTVDLIATVVATDGGALPGVLVTFNANQGTLGSSTALTNAAGEARTTLTTNQPTTVSATAGLVTSSDITITARSGPAITISCTPAAGTGNCAAVATNSNNQATVVFTVTRPTGSSSFRAATIDFGDGTSQSLGTMAGGSATVTHTYAGPADPGSRAYTATVQATDINNETTSASTSVIVTRAAPATLSVTISSATSEAATSAGQRWSFTATASESGTTTTPAITSYRWDFGDGEVATTSGPTTAHVYDTEATPQRRIVTVTATAADGRDATGRTEIIVSSFP